MFLTKTMLCILLVILAVRKVFSENCTSCISKNQVFCFSQERCGWLLCPAWTDKLLNCPDERENVAEYNETFVREIMLVTSAAASAEDPQKCFDNALPTMKLVNRYEAQCSDLAKCTAYISLDNSNSAINLAFRGTQGDVQLVEQALSYVKGNRAFFQSGKIYNYFYEAFIYLWTSGIERDLLPLLDKYPDYEVWINGHSLGGAIASVCAAYLVQIDLVRPQNIRLVTFGQPRTGDYEFATWIDSRLPYTFRIVNQRDPVPQLPPKLGLVQMFHFRTEVWYKTSNDFEICSQADGPFCSASQIFTTWSDHSTYFSINIGKWAQDECKKWNFESIF